MFLVLFSQTPAPVKKIHYLLLLCCAFFTLTTYIIHAADILLAPASGSYSSGQTFTVTVQTDPKGKQINAVEGTLRFNPAQVTVVSTSMAGSAFSLWTTEPAFSNTAGTVTFGGGSPTPFSARSPLFTVTFRTVAQGSATISVTDASILAADGRGTEVFGTAVGGTYTIAAQTATPTPTPATPTPAPAQEADSNAAIAFGDPPRAPEVGSQTFLDADVWYNHKSGRFVWEVPFDVTEIAFAISTSTEFVPSDSDDNIEDASVEELILTSEMLVDGLQYLSIQFKNQVGWGAIQHRMIKIDTLPPDPFIIRVRTGTTPSSFPTLEFEANDSTSGIDYYELEINNREPVRVTPDEARLGYLLGELEDGTYTAKVTAYDMAGNSTIATVPVLITAGWVRPVVDAETTSFWSFFTGKNLFILFLLLVIIGQLVFMYFDRRQRNYVEQKLRKETKEIQDQMSKIFSALRDEIYDQINTITKRPRLSKSEKDAVEQLNQALEVSETLIEKEINDVKSILK